MSLLPKPDRDPYFNRMTGADQVPPLAAVGEVSRFPVEGEPAIVSDYRQRGRMIGFERDLRRTGRGALMASWLLIAYQVVGLIRTLRGEPNIVSRLQEPSALIRSPWVVRLSIEAVSILLLFSIGQGLKRGSPWAFWLITLFVIGLTFTAFPIDPPSPFAFPICLSSAMILLTIWRPAGRRYFSTAYRELRERTPAITVNRRKGRLSAFLLLMALLVIHFSSRQLLLNLLVPD